MLKKFLIALLVFTLMPNQIWSHSEKSDAEKDFSIWKGKSYLGGLINRANPFSSPDSHAPIGVMGDHLHKQGEVMFSYRYMYMDMDGNRDGHDSVSIKRVLREFPVAPFVMQMHMHMIGMMYGLTDDITLATMIPFVLKSMDHKTRMGGRFKTRAEGLGDIKTSALIRLWKNEVHDIHLNAGVSLPSGEIDETDNTPAGRRTKLPYPMQLGSGTVDLLPGITYSGRVNDWSWGLQGLANIRLGRNDNDYSLGNEWTVTSWLTRKICRYLSASGRLEFKNWENVDGADPDLKPALIPTADPDLRGGKRLDALIGLNYIVPEGRLAGNRVAVEFGAPLFQSLQGPQLGVDWFFTVGWQLAF